MLFNLKDWENIHFGNLFASIGEKTYVLALGTIPVTGVGFIVRKITENIGFFTTRLKNAKFNGCKNDNFQLYFFHISFFLLLFFFKHRLRVYILTRSDTN